MKAHYRLKHSNQGFVIENVLYHYNSTLLFFWYRHLGTIYYTVFVNK